MRGMKPYRIQVYELDSLIFTQPLEAHISGTAKYIKPSQNVLGAGNTFYIDVPKGKHKFSIKVPDFQYNVIFRFYIPAKDLGNSTTNGLSDRVGFLQIFQEHSSG
ncbi:hypothetical protein A3K80_06635 [Candidatus Bathyarchaeota archaeon RBG_13_38_9]|nr:MAG: hypothetical protein A3K80_06635 [Candidatus Bathyarchaeota archaeon RBG_13_38_9]